MQLADLALTVVSFLLTVLVLSYIILGDNPLFRFATYAFIGVTAAYVLIISIDQVLWPRLIQPILMGSNLERLYLVAPLGLSILILMKLSPRFARVGNPSMAYLVGVGAAVTIGGAVAGTLFPQTLATINLFDLRSASAQASGLGAGILLLDGSWVLLGTIATLAYFHFGAREKTDQPPQRSKGVEILAGLGKAFIAITFGALFAGVFIAALTALVERVYFLFNTFM